MSEHALLIERGPYGIEAQELISSHREFTHSDVWHTASVQYAYDQYNRLIEEDFYLTGIKYHYTYDSYGNRLTKTVTGDPSQNGVTSYDYHTSWSDQLSTHPEGTPIVYDNIGNPISYGGATYTWEGRRLVSALVNGISYTYTYNSQGLRTQTVVEDSTEVLDTIQYIYQDTLLVAEIHDEYALYFTYDEQGKPFTLSYDNGSGVMSHYYYYVSYLGDVLGLLTPDGELAATYLYDAWGNLLEDELTLIGSLNPLRYRSYYYDSDLSLYYLQSRYYDSTTGRFISTDSTDFLDLSHLQGMNLYTYGLNNPVMHTDPNRLF